MPTPFSRSTRSLDADHFRPSAIAISIALTLLGAWVLWFFGAAISRYEMTDTARVEVDEAAHALQSPCAGRIVSNRLSLGAKVQSGEVLVELDTESQRLQLAEEVSRMTAITSRLEAIGTELAAERQVQDKEQQAFPPKVDEARAKFRESEALAQLSEGEARRMARLHEAGVLSEADLGRSRAEAQSRRAAAESLGVGVQRVESEERVRQKVRQAHLQQFSSEAVKLTGERQILSASIRRLEYEIERRKVRAPVSGHIGEVADVRVGSVTAEGEKLAVVVPEGRIRIVADFAPSSAIGRIHTGQTALMRLYGFPWAQYGTVSARVSAVGSEVRNDRVRVELAVNVDPKSKIPLQHGLPGSVEVEVEKVSPATLVLRAAGKQFMSSKDSSGTRPDARAGF